MLVADKGPEYFFREFVMPNYREFLLDQLSVRLAYNTAISITHVADHIAERVPGQKSATAIRQEFTKENKAFKMVDAMASAIKHVYSEGGGKVHPRTSTTTGMAPAGPETVIFHHVMNGQEAAFRPETPLLVFDYHLGGIVEKVRVAWALFEAVYFVAAKVGCSRDLVQPDRPDQTNLVFTFPGT